jgi:carbonic anhydrase/acetyltransferase-like protein (isoleucine patch superfamily)
MNLVKVYNGVKLALASGRQKLRHWVLKQAGINIDPTAIIVGNSKLYGRIQVGAETLIRNSEVDGRGAVNIGRKVMLLDCKLVTGYHNLDSEIHEAIYKPITIEDYAIIYQGSIVLPGCRIGRGAVVAAHSVVKKDVEPMTIVGGVPARRLRQRAAVHSGCNMRTLGGVHFREKWNEYRNNLKKVLS